MMTWGEVRAWHRPDDGQNNLMPGLLQSARERGNAYLELELNTRMILVFLAADDADGAERRAQESIAHWSQRGIPASALQLCAHAVQAALYRREARQALEVVESCQRPLQRSLCGREPPCLGKLAAIGGQLQIESERWMAAQEIRRPSCGSLLRACRPDCIP
jgi:hypothetical protein